MSTLESQPGVRLPGQLPRPESSDFSSQSSQASHVDPAEHTRLSTMDQDLAPLNTEALMAVTSAPAEKHVPNALRTLASNVLLAGNTREGFIKGNDACAIKTLELRKTGESMAEATRARGEKTQAVLQANQEKYSSLEAQLKAYWAGIKDYERTQDGLQSRLSKLSGTHDYIVSPDGEWGGNYLNKTRKQTGDRLNTSYAEICFGYQQADKVYRRRTYVENQFSENDRNLEEKRILRDAASFSLSDTKQKIAGYEEFILHKSRLDRAESEAQRIFTEGQGNSSEFLSEEDARKDAIRLILQKIRSGEKGYEVSPVEPITELEDDRRSAGDIFVDNYLHLKSDQKKSRADFKINASEVNSLEVEQYGVGSSGGGLDDGGLKLELRQANLLLRLIEESPVVPQGFLTVQQVKSKQKKAEKLASDTEAAQEPILNNLNALVQQFSQTMSEAEAVPEPKYVDPNLEQHMTSVARIRETIVQIGFEGFANMSDEDVLRGTFGMLAQLKALQEGNPNKDPRIQSQFSSMFGAFFEQFSGVRLGESPESATRNAMGLYKTLIERPTPPPQRPPQRAAYDEQPPAYEPPKATPKEGPAWWKSLTSKSK